MVERLVPRESTNHIPCLQAFSTTQLSNKILCLALFWVPVLETWLLATFRSSLPVAISVCLLSSVSAWARLSFHLYLSHSRHLEFSPLWCILLTYSERSSNLLSLGTSNMSLVAPNLSSHELSSACLFFEALLWYIVLDTLQAADRWYLCVFVAWCVYVSFSIFHAVNKHIFVCFKHCAWGGYSEFALWELLGQSGIYA